MRKELSCQRMRRRMMLVAAAVLAVAVAVTPRAASAEGLFDFLFSGAPKQQQRQAAPLANFFADPFGLNGPGRHQPAGSATKEAISPGRFVRADVASGQPEARPAAPTAAGSSLRLAHEETARHAHQLREQRSAPNPREAEP